MKNKKKKRNYYIIAFFIYIFILFFIDVYLEGSVAEYFVRTILEDREEVKYMDIFTRIRGNFRWDRLRRILTFIAVGGFLAIEASIYVASRIFRENERKKVLEEVESRIRQFNDNKALEDSGEFKSIDMEIESILNEKEKIKQEKELEIRKKNDLVTYLAHDLKTPLTSIIGYLNILEESEVPENIQKSYLQSVLDKAYHLEELTNQFFDITRFNLQEIPLNITDIDGNFFLEQITDELYPLLKVKKLQIQLDIVQDFKIYADGNLLARALNNLLKNAISYSDKNSIIEVIGAEKQGKTIITVKNYGNVISSQELELIFEKFYRRDKSRSQSSGSGLGLAITKEIIERHNGLLEAQSTNGYTNFTISLPKSL